MNKHIIEFLNTTISKVSIEPSYMNVFIVHNASLTIITIYKHHYTTK